MIRKKMIIYQNILRYEQKKIMWYPIFLLTKSYCYSYQCYHVFIFVFNGVFRIHIFISPIIYYKKLIDSALRLEQKVFDRLKICKKHNFR